MSTHECHFHELSACEPNEAHLHQEPNTPATKNRSREAMFVHTKRRTHLKRNAAVPYASAPLPTRQSLLAILADIDFEHASDVQTVRDSSVDELIKQAVIRTLEERHRHRRAPYVERLKRLERRMQTLFA